MNDETRRTQDGNGSGRGVKDTYAGKRDVRG